jgi:hypothetical protein
VPEDDIGRIEASIRQAEAGESTLDSAIKARNRLRAGKDRSIIVLVVFIVYILVIAAIVGYLLYRAVAFQENVFNSFSEILKIAVVPIVTLVIGYYFGTERADRF